MLFADAERTLIRRVLDAFDEYDAYHLHPHSDAAVQSASTGDLPSGPSTHESHNAGDDGERQGQRASEMDLSRLPCVAPAETLPAETQRNGQPETVVVGEKQQLEAQLATVMTERDAAQAWAREQLIEERDLRQQLATVRADTLREAAEELDQLETMALTLSLSIDKCQLYGPADRVRDLARQLPLRLRALKARAHAPEPQRQEGA